MSINRQKSNGYQHREIENTNRCIITVKSVRLEQLDGFAYSILEVVEEVLVSEKYQKTF